MENGLESDAVDELAVLEAEVRHEVRAAEGEGVHRGDEEPGGADRLAGEARGVLDDAAAEAAVAEDQVGHAVEGGPGRAGQLEVLVVVAAGLVDADLAEGDIHGRAARVGAVAADVVAEAVLRAVHQATSLHDIPSLRDL